MYIVEDWFIKLKIFLFDISDSLFHLLLDLFDFFVSFIDGNGLHLFRKREILDAFFHFLQSDLSLLLNKQTFTKKSNISTMNQLYSY